MRPARAARATEPRLARARGVGRAARRDAAAVVVSLGGVRAGRRALIDVVDVAFARPTGDVVDAASLAPPSAIPPCRYKLNFATWVAELVWEFRPGVYTQAQGSVYSLEVARE